MAIRLHSRFASVSQRLRRWVANPRTRLRGSRLVAALCFVGSLFRKSVALLADVSQIVALAAVVVVLHQWRAQLLVETTKALAASTSLWSVDGTGCRLPPTNSIVAKIESTEQRLDEAKTWLDRWHPWLGQKRYKDILRLAVVRAEFDIEQVRAPTAHEGLRPLSSEAVASLCIRTSAAQRALEEKLAIPPTTWDTWSETALTEAYQSLVEANRLVASQARSLQTTLSGDDSRREAFADAALRCNSAAEQWARAARASERSTDSGADKRATFCMDVSVARYEHDTARLRELWLREPLSWAAPYFYASTLYESFNDDPAIPLLDRQRALHEIERAAAAATQVAPSVPLSRLLASEARYRHAKSLASQRCHSRAALASYRAVANERTQTIELLRTEWPIYADEAATATKFLRNHANAAFEIGSADIALVQLEQMRGAMSFEEWNDPESWMKALETKFRKCLGQGRCEESLAYRLNDFRFAVHLDK
jgi:hypothetical protein